MKQNNATAKTSERNQESGGNRSARGAAGSVDYHDACVNKHSSEFTISNNSSRSTKFDSVGIPVVNFPQCENATLARSDQPNIGLQRTSPSNEQCGVGANSKR